MLVIKRLLMMVLISGTIVSCGSHQQNVDLIVYNAKIYTVDGQFSIAQAMAIMNGRIVELGSDKGIHGKYVSDVVYDAKGKYIYPGFIDGHCHFYGYGCNSSRADLTACSSYEEMISRVVSHSKRNSEGWIEGRGWDQNLWVGQQFPDNVILDSLFPNRPVFLIRIDGHAALANTAALNAANINSDTKIAGGYIELKNGKPTGLLLDNAVDLVQLSMPPRSQSQNIDALLTAQDTCFSYGLTMVADAGLDKPIVQLIDSLQQQEKLDIRVYAMLNPTDENFETFIKNGIYKTSHLIVCSVKLYADGALGSRGALLLEPYTDDPENKGIMVHDTAYIRRICVQAMQYNYQVNIHCIGDAAVQNILNIYGSLLKEENDRRWRIEHAQVVHSDDFVRFGQFGIIPSVQPAHATSDMGWAEQRLGDARIIGAYAYQTLLKQNGWLIYGSDFPIEHVNPLLGYYAAVSRKDINGNPAEGFFIEQALSREDALRAMTIWAAKGCFFNDEIGSLEPGKWADFVVLDNDIITIPVEKIPEVNVIATFVAGKQVWKR